MPRAARRAGGGDVLRLLFSRDAGINWDQIWSAPSGAFDTRVDLPHTLVGGAHEFLLRVEMSATDPSGCGLDDVSVTTLTQVNAFTLPRFQAGENKVRFFLGEQLASQTIWPVLHDDGSSDRYRDTAESWTNMDAAPDADAFYRSVLRPASSSAPAQVTWRLSTPTPMTRVEYGGSFIARIDSPDDHVDLSHAFDGGAYTLAGSFDADAAPGTWDGRLYAVADAPPGADEVRMRYDIESTASEVWNAAGIQSLLMTVLHEPRDPAFAPVEVTFNWTEFHDGAQITRAHTRIVDGSEDMWLVNVGGDRDPRMNWVRLRLADGSVAEGYQGGDPGPGAGYDKQVVRFDWLDDVSRGRPYTVSRPASSANPDGDDDLTNGCIGPPTTYWNHSIVQEQGVLWESGAPVVVTLDLGAQQPVAALRICTNQPNANYVHPAAITAEISDDGATWRPYGEVDHGQVWRPMGNHLDWGYAHSSAYDDLPAGGRLAYPFWILPPASESGRHLRLTFDLQEGRGLGVSEIQAFDQVTVEDWPDREVWMPGTTGVTDGESGGDAPRAQPALHCAPNPFNPVTRVEFEVPLTGPVSLRVFDVRGREVRVLRDRVLAAGRHVVTWDGRDAAGRPLAAGAYFLTLRTAAGERVSKAVLVK